MESMMILQCVNCQAGPCEIESSIAERFNKGLKTKCFFNYSNGGAEWNVKDIVIASIETQKIVEKKEPELMTLQEIFEKAKIGERIEHSAGGASFIKGEDFPPFGLSYRSAIEKKWQIIPVEPKVLTFQNYWDREIEELGKFFSSVQMNFLFDECKKGFESGIKNGRLERDLEYKELRKIIADALNGHTSVVGLDELIGAIKNLKPLNSK